MSKVILDITMSLDGFIAGPQDEIGPLHDWIFSSRAGDFLHLTVDGRRLVKQAFDSVGAIIAGRRTYDVTHGWDGSHPIPAPLFVLTHSVPKDVPKGSTSFTFVTDGIESAVIQAQYIAADKDVSVMGGGVIASQALKAGVVDEINLHIAHVLLGRGIRLFGDLGPKPIMLERISLSESPEATHLRFRVIRERLDGSI
jgi:dihydrofolate reductase